MEKPKLMYRVDEAVEATGISRTRIYEFLASGDLESISLGRTRLIPADALERFVDWLRREANSADDEFGTITVSRR